MIKVLHVVASLAEASGGPPRSVVSLCLELAEKGFRPSIVTLANERYFGKPLQVDEKLVRVFRAPCFYFKPLRLILSAGFSKFASALIADVDVVHSHGLWLGVNRSAAAAARRLGKPHLVSPRGNLHPSCLAQSRLKKLLARKAFVNGLLSNAQCIHATSKDEIHDIRAFGISNHVAYIPVPVTIPRYLQFANTHLEGLPVFGSRRLLLFLGRVHPHKGIFELADSWRRLHRSNADWHLVIAGPDEVGCLHAVRKRLGSAQISTTFLGQVSGDAKWALLARSELLVLPTHSENFGHVIGEALSLEKPVLTTTAAPWHSLVEYNCGWQIEANETALRSCLTKVLALPPVHLASMGKNGMRLLREQHDPAVIGKRYGDTYRWLANRAPKPEWIF